MEKLQEVQPVLEVLREDGSNLSDLAPGDAGLKVEETLNKDLQRYDAVSEQIQRRSQKVSKSKQRSSEVGIGSLPRLHAGHSLKMNAGTIKLKVIDK